MRDALDMAQAEGWRVGDVLRSDRWRRDRRVVSIDWGYGGGLRLAEVGPPRGAYVSVVSLPPDVHMVQCGRCAAAAKRASAQGEGAAA